MAVSVVVPAFPGTARPGAETRCRVRVRNTGPVVDQCTVLLVGEPSDWTRVEPPSVNLLPDAERELDLVFAPPRSPEVLAGEKPFAIRVLSREDPEGSVVEEGTVTVEAFSSIVTELVPRSSAGRRTGAHTVATDNLGNEAKWLTISAADPDDRLDFRIKPRSALAEAGYATFVKVKARPKKTFWKGVDRTLPFQVSVHPEGEDVFPLNGIMTQRQLLPRGLLLALALLIALALVLAIMLNTILASTPISTARSTQPSPTSVTSSSSSPASGSASSSAGARPGGSGKPSGSGPSPASRSSASPPHTVRIRTDAGPVSGDAQLFSYAVRRGYTLAVTTVRLRNTARDAGTLQIRRDDQTLLSIVLDTFTGQSYQPGWTFTGGQAVVVAVTCQNTRKACTPEVEFTGSLTGA
ncbi:hypothetical protein AB5J62_22435 [Amycolatopsis sp. cg5]|uniref:COG1470 family protein n=1 Tax=Amycolatopsis sp. cg5 TaxID=3238802 RepID=UPI00352612AE